MRLGYKSSLHSIYDYISTRQSAFIYFPDYMELKPGEYSEYAIKASSGDNIKLCRLNTDTYRLIFTYRDRNLVEELYKDL